MASEDTIGPRRARPLSPHLQVYKPIITMVMSIMHRATGILNVAGLVLVVGYLLALAAGPDAHAWGNALYSSWPARVVLVGFTWSLIHHAIGGIRHLAWDVGLFFGPIRRMISYGTLVLSIVLTIALWAGVLLMEAN